MRRDYEPMTVEQQQYLERQLAEAREWAKTVSHTATCRRQDFVGGYDEAACGRCQIARILKEE